MGQKSPSVASIIAWIIAIPVVNGILLLLYAAANPPLPFWSMVWNYMETDVFKLITGSLIIPLLFSILEKRYKFMENIRRRREEKRKQIEDQRNQSRQETIRDTLNMWQELFDMTSDIIFFDPEKDYKACLKPVIIKLNQFSSTGEHIVNKWTHQFPNLKPEDHDVFLYFINLLYNSGQTAAYYIRDEADPKEILTIQNVLFQIQDQVKTILNHTIANILKYSTRYLEITENTDDSGNPEPIRKNIIFLLDLLRDWRSALKNLDNEHDNFLSTASGPEIDELRKTAKKIQVWLKEDLKRQIGHSPDFPELQKRFYQIPMEERIAILRIPYTKDYLFALADWLSFETACSYLTNKVHDMQ